MTLHILPLAIVMVAGTQIVLAIVLATAEQPLKKSLAYIAGFGVSVAIGVAIAMLLSHVLHENLSNSSTPKGKSTTERNIEIGIAVLLMLESIRIYRHRANSKPSKLLDGIQSATPSATFKIGILMILAAPADIMVMLTVGLNIIRTGHDYLAALPFIGLTLLLLAAPLIARLALGHRGDSAMAKLRTFMHEKSWAVNIAVCALFIVLLLT